MGWIVLFFFFWGLCVTSKAMGAIFYLSSLSLLPPFPMLPAELRISGAMFIETFFFIVFVTERTPKCKRNYDSPSIPWLILHPRWNVCPCESQRVECGIFMQLSPGNPCRLFFRKFSRARCEIVTLKTAACFHRSAIPIKTPRPRYFR